MKSNPRLPPNWIRLGIGFAAMTVLTVWHMPSIGSVPALQNIPQKVEEFPAFKTYYQVIDLLFPRKPLGVTPSLILLTLRFTPPFEKESQIVVTKDLNGFFVVTYYSLPEGRDRIADRIAQIMKNSTTEDPHEIVARINVKVQRVKVPERVISDLMNRYSKLRMPVDIALDPKVLILDGTQYQLWYETVGGQGEIYVSFPTDDYRKGHPIYWMIEIKRVVEHYASNN